MTGAQMSNIGGNSQCFRVVEKIKDLVTKQGKDFYSVVASYIFDSPYVSCEESQLDEKNRLRRGFVKFLFNNCDPELLMDFDVDSLIGKGSSNKICDILGDNKVKALIINRFPFTQSNMSACHDDDEKFIDSLTFISMIRGFVMIPWYKNWFDDYAKSNPLQTFCKVVMSEDASDRSDLFSGDDYNK